MAPRTAEVTDVILNDFKMREVRDTELLRETLEIMDTRRASVAIVVALADIVWSTTLMPANAAVLPRATGMEWFERLMFVTSEP